MFVYPAKPAAANTALQTNLPVCWLTNINFLAPLDFIGKFDVQRKITPNELMESHITKIKMAGKTSISKFAYFYSMKKAAIRRRIIHRLTHRFPACPSPVF